MKITRLPMTNDSVELQWADLLKLADEMKSDAGPGSRAWRSTGSVAEQVNGMFLQVLRENNGKVPGDLNGIPFVILTTTGAKSGKRRAVPLFSQTVDGRLIIIGSMGGADRNPPWYYNLVKNPEVTVEKDGQIFQATAVVTEGEERAYFFQKMCGAFPIFSEYQAGTRRTIPIVELKQV